MINDTVFVLCQPYENSDEDGPVGIAVDRHIRKLDRLSQE